MAIEIFNLVKELVVYHREETSLSVENAYWTNKY